MSVELFLSYDEHLDWLTLIEFGRVDNAQPRDHWRGVSDSFGYALRSPEGSEVGFKVLGFSGFDPETPEVDEIWSGPRFDVPALGLRDSTAGEIVLAARPFLGGQSTINRVYFNSAMNAEGEEAEKLWRYCLQAGDLMAHYSLGYTLYELGRYREAYRHLRAYTELVPAYGWAWCWLGKACEAMGDLQEARATYEKAIELDGDQTDAPELLVLLVDEELRGKNLEAQRTENLPESSGLKFIGEAPVLEPGVKLSIEDGFGKGDLVLFEIREGGEVAIRQANVDDEETVYYVHPDSTPEQPTFVRANARHLRIHRDTNKLPELWRETFSDVGFFYRDADLSDPVLAAYEVGRMIQERAYVDCSYLSGGLAARHRYLIITGKARDLNALTDMDKKYGPTIIQRDSFFKVLDVYTVEGHVQITLVHIPEELIPYLHIPELNETEEEIVEAARTNFEESLNAPTVPALAESYWLERVEFPLGVSENGDPFYGGSSESSG